MPLFDRYIAVDWSAANVPRVGQDSIWIGERGRGSVNPSTRDEAMADIIERLLDARARNERVMLGFDFAFGYPRGAAEAIAGAADWQALWARLSKEVEDRPTNRSNRFEVAQRLNRQLAAPHYWGHPPQHAYVNLGPRRPVEYAKLPERRRAEVLARTAQPVWKLTGAGAVGSQALLGIPRLEALRHHEVLGPDIAIWPFETDFSKALQRPITIVEIYPSLFPLDDPTLLPKDRAQVETSVRWFAELDAAGLLGRFLDLPAGLADERRVLLREEGWIAGVGHETLLARPRSAV